MPRSSSQSSSRSSSRSAGGSRRDQEIAVHLYSRDNGHWGTMMSEQGAQRGRLYHVSSDEDKDQDRFYYNERESAVFSQSTVGRSVVGRLSSGERSRAERVIRDYASVDDNIPRYSRGQNCQTFTTGVLGRLEEERLVGPGHRDYFRGQEGRRGLDIADSLRRDGRSWIARPETDLRGPPDARFNATSQRRAPGRLNMDQFATLTAPASREASRSRSHSGHRNPLDDPNYFSRGR